MRRVLEERGVRTFLDKESLDAGQPWPKALEEALERTAAVAVFVGRNDLGSWQRREVWFALDRQVVAEEREERFPVIPVLLPGSRPATSFLFSNTWVDLRQDLADPQAIAAIVAALGGQELAPADLSGFRPYRGLKPFGFEDSPFFYGREAFSRQLRDRVLTHDLVAVVGPSGSGKSSVVQAGLLPELGRDPEGRTWETATFRPGKRPFEELGDVLMPLLEPGLGQRQLLKEGKALGHDLEAGEIRLEKLVDRLIESSGGSRGLLLICDQFEELFHETPEEQRLPFIEALLGASSDSPLRLVLTLRADFYEQALRYRDLVDRLTIGQVNLGPLTEEELKRAICEPAGRVELSFEPGLVDDILRDLRGSSEPLPLLEFCLQKIYEKRERRQLTHAGYKAVGRVAGAIAQTAGQTLEALGPEGRPAARRLFCSLVRLRPSAEGGRDTRRRVRLADLDVPRETAESFVKARLLVAGRDGEGESAGWVEIAHEALIDSWRQLGDWLERDRELLRWRQRVQETVREPGEALRGRLLGEGRRWKRERREELTEAELKSIRAGNRRTHAFFGLIALAALTALAALVVIGFGVIASQRTSDMDELERVIAGGERGPEELATELLQPEWPMRSSDVAEILERRDRLDGVLDHRWRQDEPQGLLDVVAAARPVLVRELAPYESVGRALWMLDYLAATSGIEKISTRAARLGAELRDGLRSVHGPPDPYPEFVPIDLSRATAAECGRPVGISYTFCMGSESGDDDERPEHPVRLRPYLLQVHEVTNREYRQFDPDHTYDPGQDTLPATKISWYQAYAYAAWLGGRLPTEAEWEYAAKGGCSAASGYCGRDGQEVGLGDLAWYAETHLAARHPVEQKAANQNGLHDIYGNVWEWTADWYDKEEYEAREARLQPERSVESPWGPDRSDDGGRVMRGGSFADEPEDVRPAEREKFSPGGKGLPIIGFRVLLPGTSG